MKVLITGSNGQLGNEMRVALQHEETITGLFTDVDTLNICDKNAIQSYVDLHHPDVIINCAAYTAVDKAEDDKATATLVNRDAVQNLGEIANKNNIKIISISTDYVFDGTAHIPYTEDQAVCPTNVYGHTKLAGEMALLEICPQAIIVRTSWLYSSFGNNFVKTMLRLGKERDSLGVIFDQVGTPTYAADLAEALIKILKSEVSTPGIYHFSNEGVCSWYDFTIQIHQLSNISCQVTPINSDAYPVRTPRPHYSVLDKGKIKATFNLTIPHWTDGLRRCLNILNKA